MNRLIFGFSVLAPVLIGIGHSNGEVSFDWVTIGNPGNAGDTEVMVIDGSTGYDSVDDPYRIGRYEVTNAQYCEFLNAVAHSDPNGLYSTDMASGWMGIGGITRDGSDGGYTYTVRENRGNRPINYVSWYDTLRFANWLHNGQPTGPQDASTTEDGTYDMSLGSSVVRKVGALFFLPTENEWYKAAYYKGGGPDAGYWDYPTQSDTAPTSESPAGTDMVNGSANYYGPGNVYVDGVYFSTEVGAYSAKPSDSAYGTYDQGGNLGEWNETLIYGSVRGIRGGSFDSDDDALHAACRGSGFPTHELIIIGFRIASLCDPINPADFDEDGDVDRDDFLVWQYGFGATESASRCDGDADGDSDVDGSDFLVWQYEYGSGSGFLGSIAVPEPTSTALLLTITLFALILTHWR